VSNSLSLRKGNIDARFGLMRKTKKEKVRAANRKAEIVNNFTPSSGLIYKFDGPKIADDRGQQEKITARRDSSFNWVQGDLKKTLIVTVLAFSLELCVYWVLERGGWSKIVNIFS
jgi:hypothetical protein